MARGQMARGQMARGQVARRRDIPEAQRWNEASVFASPQDWERAFGEVGEALSSLARFKGRLGEGPERLADWLEASQDFAGELGKVFVYASMQYSCDTSDSAASARFERARSLYARAAAATAFAEPELLEIGFETLRAWLDEPRLAPYAHYLERLEAR
ncbi:MAG: oligoendopeptidase F, partial [Deinococcota bacterium]|nr:oligoendopeptidase F [Deinococcota bacterium]